MSRVVIGNVKAWRELEERILENGADEKRQCNQTTAHCKFSHKLRNSTRNAGLSQCVDPIAKPSSLGFGQALHAVGPSQSKDSPDLLAHESTSCRQLIISTWRDGDNTHVEIA